MDCLLEINLHKMLQLKHFQSCPHGCLKYLVAVSFIIKYKESTHTPVYDVALPEFGTKIVDIMPTT